jgi:TonB family protein
MFRADRFIFIAICASLLLHAGLLTVAAEKARYDKVYLPPLRRPGSTVTIALQPPPPPLDDMGDRNGAGTASSASQGPTPLQARQADQDQPQLSRDPSGPAKMGHQPSPSDAPPGERGRGGQRGEIFVQTPPEQTSPPRPTEKSPLQKPLAGATPPPPSQQPAKPALPKPVAQPTLATDLVAEATAKLKTLLIPPPAKSPAEIPAPSPKSVAVQPKTPPTPSVPPAPAVAAVPPAPTPPKPSEQVQVQPATGDGLAPGRAAAADPYQQSDSESDAFTTVGSAVVHDGRINVRSGRRIKTVRPLLLVPGILDTLGVSDPTVQLKVNIDASGKVAFVTVVHSSGSNDIDQPCVVAMYDWWFEPSRDSKGKPIPDVVLFTLSFR